ncbi:glycosyltransferase family 4 protein [Zunongwangia endophytica]|uniref:Glycosyltransferase family 4 protein n=1 Tax=Zunongwangia endophytica TaxID=1808945 RepID=A0ABV8H3E3_9FLAO|nr:glycosyltransferase family 4 protein [Zunongwangia endophytica]MDN3595900.1 glycosyltransferase family 4 protein [Zunongwangia endophytica]
MQKEVCIITSYFPPETGAASNRIYSLAKGFEANNFKVSVITPLPNYPTGKVFPAYKGKWKDIAEENNLKIYRLWIFASNSKNILFRLLAMLSYSISLLLFFATHKLPSKVVIQSPPLLVAFTCVLFLKNKKKDLIVNISDLWPLAGLELGAFKRNFTYKCLEKIESIIYKRADIILGQSEEIIAHIYQKSTPKKTFLYRNYPEFEIPEIQERTNNEPNSKIKIVYAGLVGMAQGIYKLCTKLDYSTIEFHIYGDGAEKQKIEEYIAKNKHLPIFYHGKLDRTELHLELLKYDFTIVPLVKRIYGSVPSKIFEYAKLGIPTIYFAGGEGGDLVAKYELGYTIAPEDYHALNTQLNHLNSDIISTKNQLRIRKTAAKYFDFELQMKKLIALLH